MKKKIIALLLACVMVVGMTGCSSEIKDAIVDEAVQAGKDVVGNYIQSEKDDLNSYWEDFTADWPDGVKDVVDDAWNEFNTTVITPDYKVPDDNYVNSGDEKENPDKDTTNKNEDNDKKPSNEKYDESMYVHFIDVGQADSTLVILGDNVMLIDAGNNSDDKIILDYLNKLNIDQIDYFILTHPHEDHIGGADTIINEIDIENVWMADFSATSKTYKDVIAAINNNTLVPHYPEHGETFQFGNAEVLVVGPSTYDVEETNNSSIGLKISYGEDDILLCGDTETDMEKEILKLGYDLEAEIFKANHHGSGGSNSYVWLKEVNPYHVVIHVGEDNSYEHPHDEALSRFNDVGAYIYRTDTMGTIVAEMTGDGVEFNVDGIKPTRPHTN